MAVIHLDFVSQDHMVFSGEVEEITAPGAQGIMTVLPKHAPLLTVLAPGEVVVRRGSEPDLYFAVSGGWMEVRPTQVTVLARTAERAEEIDLRRAEESRARAEQMLSQGVPWEERAALEEALRRSQIRLKVASRRGRRGGPGPRGGAGGASPEPER